MQSAHGPTAVHSVSLSRRWLLGARQRNVPAYDRRRREPPQGVDSGQPAREDAQQSILSGAVGLARSADVMRAQRILLR